jgi:phosphoglycolate phosphatase
MNIRHWIFDLDGTVVDTLRDLHAAVNTTLVTFNLETITLDETKAFIGSGAKQFVRAALKSHGQDEGFFNRFYEAYMVHYEAYQLQGSHPYAGVTALLNQLKVEGKFAYIFSNKPHDLAVQLIAQVFPGMFAAVHGHKPNTPPKPDPTMFYEFVKLNQIDLSASVMIGDGIPDLQLGRIVGIPTVAVRYGYTDGELLKTYEPDAMVNQVEEIYPTVIKLEKKLRS